MSKISIVADTDISLSPAVTDKYGIRQVPITIHFGEEVYETWVDLNDAALMKLIDEKNAIPTTAAPSPGKFAEAYKAAFEEDGADAVVCLTVSGEVSATYDAARVAAEELMPEKNITVVDTKQLSLGQGFMTLAAARVAKVGASVEEVVAAAEDVRERVHYYGALATLKYLRMSGRVSYVTAGMASLLDIKPIVAIQEGKLEMLERTRTRKKSWLRVIELVGEAVGEGKIEEMGIVHVDAAEDAAEFVALLRESLDCPEEILVDELSAGLSVHSGSGMVGVGVVVK